MISVMIYNRLLFSVAVRVTPVATASSSTLMSSSSSSYSSELITFSLPFRERTRIGGSSFGSFFSFRMMCFFRCLGSTLWDDFFGQSSSSSSFSVGEKFISDLPPSFSWDGSFDSSSILVFFYWSLCC